MILVPIPADLVALAWPDVLPWIAAACARVPSDLTADRLLASCLAGEALLVLLAPDRYAAPVGAGVTQVRRHEGGALSCWVLCVGGARPGAWRDVAAAIEAGARAKGCIALEFVGRPGWARLLPDFTCQRAGRRAEYRKELA